MKFKNRTIRGGASLDQLNWNASMKSDERQKANYMMNGKGRKKRKKERKKERKKGIGSACCVERSEKRGRGCDGSRMNRKSGGDGRKEDSSCSGPWRKGGGGSGGGCGGGGGGGGDESGEDGGGSG